MLKRPQSNTTCIYRLLFCCCPTVKISQTFQVTDVKKGVRKSMHRPAIVCQQSDRVIIILQSVGGPTNPSYQTGLCSHCRCWAHINRQKPHTANRAIYISLNLFKRRHIIHYKEQCFLTFHTLKTQTAFKGARRVDVVNTSLVKDLNRLYISINQHTLQFRANCTLHTRHAASKKKL